MSELIALGFDSEAEAEAFRDRLAEMERTSVLQIRDAAEVLLGETGRPRIRHASDLVGPGALGGVFWGVFFALVFLLPGLGPIIAAGLALIHERVGDAGLERGFIAQLGETIQPGQAGWVLLADDVDEARFLEAVGGTNARVLRTTLAPDEEAATRYRQPSRSLRSSDRGQPDAHWDPHRSLGAPMARSTPVGSLRTRAAAHCRDGTDMSMAPGDPQPTKRATHRRREVVCYGI